MARMARTARVAWHGVAQWHLGNSCYYHYLPQNVGPQRKHGSAAYRRLGLARSVGQPPASHPGNGPITATQAQSRPSRRHSDGRLCALQTTARHPGVIGVIGLIGPCRLPACFTPPAELLADVFFAPCRPIAPQPRRKLHSYPPSPPQQPSPSALSSFASGHAAVHSLRHQLSCPSFYAIHLHTRPPPPHHPRSTAADRLNQAAATSLQYLPPPHPALPLFLFVLPAWSAIVLSAFFASLANLSNLDLQRIVHRLPRLHPPPSPAHRLAFTTPQVMHSH
jgi:hypothetical protein